MKLGLPFLRTTLLLSIVFGEREEPANQPCTTHSLTEACPDDNVVEDDLNASCENLHGIPAAKCYMEYLCAHHDQAAVIGHKACIDQECPLAKHVPTKQCNETDFDVAATGGSEGGEENATTETLLDPEELISEESSGDTEAQAPETQTYFTNPVNERAVSCPDDPNQIGYKHVTDVNVDQQTELDRLARGETPRTPYIFPFCNKYKYLMEQEVLQVLLDDITFVCGYNGKNEELCVLEGGDLQVNIAEGGNVKNVVFQGMSFFEFKGIAIKAYGKGKITINDASFQEFEDKAIAVDQRVPTGGGTPMEVEINKATFRNGYGSNIVDNVGGKLTFADMTIIEKVRVDSMIRTSAGGTSDLTNVDVTLSDITRIVHTTGGSKQTVTKVDVYEMNSIGSLFFVEGSGSELIVSDVTVTENMLEKGYIEQTSRNFNVFIAKDSATGKIATVSVTECDGVDRVFSASAGAEVTVTDATIKNIIGTQPPDLLSNIAMAEDGGSMNVLRLTAENVKAFSAAFFAICGSSIQVKQSCVMSGDMAAPVFISADSKGIVDVKGNRLSEGNYLNVEDLTVARCLNDVKASVFTEDSVEAQCFSQTGTGACTGKCVEGFTESKTCLAPNGPSSYTLTPQPAPPGGGGNPSCPASPPTPMPTLPPGIELDEMGGIVLPADEGGSGDEKPAFTATIPPGQIGSPAAGGDGGGGSGSGSGGNNFGGDGGGSGASALSPGSPVQIGSALLVAKLLHTLRF